MNLRENGSNVQCPVKTFVNRHVTETASLELQPDLFLGLTLQIGRIVHFDPFAVGRVRASNVLEHLSGTYIQFVKAGFSDPVEVIPPHSVQPGFIPGTLGILNDPTVFARIEQARGLMPVVFFKCVQ